MRAEAWPVDSLAADTTTVDTITGDVKTADTMAGASSHVCHVGSRFAWNRLAVELAAASRLTRHCIPDHIGVLVQTHMTTATQNSSTRSIGSSLDSSSGDGKPNILDDAVFRIDAVFANLTVKHMRRS